MLSMSVLSAALGVLSEGLGRGGLPPVGSNSKKVKVRTTVRALCEQLGTLQVVFHKNLVVLLALTHLHS